MDRRFFIKSAASVSILSGLGLLSTCSSDDDDVVAIDTDTDIDTDAGTDTSNTLYIPDLIEDTGSGIALAAGAGTTAFVNGVANETWGFNDSYLGPTVKVRRGDAANFAVTNNLSEGITTHWHGLHIPGEVDGGPYQMVDPGETWQPTLNIEQEASTNWYHSHVHGNTGRQVYMGLAGLFIIEDDNSDSLDLPSEYGVDDIPLVIQDKLFDAAGVLNYDVDNAPGGRFLGNTMLANGVVDASVEVEAKRIRFRILNASNARFYNFSLSDGSTFYKVATEGGFLNAPVAMTSMLMAPGERNEIVVDLTGYTAGAQISIQSSNEENNDTNLPATFDVLNIAVVDLSTANPALPTTMNTVPDVDAQVAAVTVAATRTFNLAAGEINGQEFNMGVINHVTNQGDYEIWEIRGADHPFHMHGCSFLIIDDNGVSPNVADAGWKDTVVTRPGTTGVRVLVQFNYLAPSTAAYMYHCHILGHEDQGMMGQFTVV